jgi:sporulation protein YlmC with PRC-barrel domain
MPQRRLSLVHELLELQVVDRGARPVGRVDDIELGDDGSTVLALLIGGEALARRFRGPIARLWAGTYRRVQDDRRRTAVRISPSDVLRVDSRVDLVAERDTLGVGRVDDWLNTHVVEQMPGNDYAPE